MHAPLRGSTALVTGAGGFVGAALVDTLLRAGADVHAVVRPGGDASRLERTSVQVHACDVTERDAVDSTFGEVRPAVVFNLAAARPQGAMAAVNVHGTENVLSMARRHGVQRVVQLGSSLEYGAGGRFRETDPAAPLEEFGRTKAAGTALCLRAARELDQDVVVLRPFNVYGPHDKPSRLVPTAIRAALEHRELPLASPGLQRDWVYVDDVTAACVAAADAEGVGGEVVNVATGKQAAVEDVVALVEAAAGRSIRVRRDPGQARPWDRAAWVADVAKADELLGWRPKVELRDGIARTYAWYAERTPPLPLSVVLPVFKTAPALAELHRRLVAVLEPLGDFELVVVDDASPDGAGAAADELAARDPRVRVRHLPTNLGQQQAILVGLDEARGERVVVMDADLQDPPEAIPALLAASRSGTQAVFAGRRGRYESDVRLATSRLYKRVNHLLCGVPPDAGAFVLLERVAVDRLLELRGPPPSLVSMIGVAGTNAISVPVERAVRASGESGYDTAARVGAAARGLGWGLLWRWRPVRRFFGFG